ncbi:hypothetical protein ebA3182 [Aromatoleum aromaticum EbN1]|uniref:Uncharacterized protein n=1 Tax=Aromatoleum aromaticum (strain DSM 19018 / LMG 30748 / EbN1) TaxID=76114 RepID=Q5P449_AROAE|nr:hypothetical protein ebA3182 [Aromatoleum aromaticum EbN1]
MLHGAFAGHQRIASAADDHALALAGKFPKIHPLLRSAATRDGL